MGDLVALEQHDAATQIEEAIQGARQRRRASPQSQDVEVGRERGRETIEAIGEAGHDARRRPAAAAVEQRGMELAG